MNLEAAARLIARGDCIALTGAGISVDSGIPDFRSPGGLWERFDPMEYATIDAFRRDPRKVWRFLRELSQIVIDARPNAGHEALAELEALGLLHAVVTQNVDGLHQAAGSKRVVEFHGGGDRLVCLGCRARTPREALPRGALPPGWVPQCDTCGEILKPDVVFFGEAIPASAMRDALDLAGSCRAVLVVGTSATVAPFSSVPHLAQQAGAAVIEFNLERTVLSSRADVHVGGSATVTLPAVVEAVKAAR